MPLPKNPTAGRVYRVTNPKTGRVTCFLATGKTGFGKWRIVPCQKTGRGRK